MLIYKRKEVLISGTYVHNIIIIYDTTVETKNEVYIDANEVYIAVLLKIKSKYITSRFVLA